MRKLKRFRFGLEPEISSIQVNETGTKKDSHVELCGELRATTKAMLIVFDLHETNLCDVIIKMSSLFMTEKIFLVMEKSM